MSILGRSTGPVLFGKVQTVGKPGIRKIVNSTVIIELPAEAEEGMRIKARLRHSYDDGSDGTKTLHGMITRSPGAGLQVTIDGE